MYAEKYKDTLFTKVIDKRTNVPSSPFPAEELFQISYIYVYTFLRYNIQHAREKMKYALLMLWGGGEGGEKV